MRGRLHIRMLWGFLIGALGGGLAQWALGGHPLLDDLLRYVVQPIGQIFLRLLFMLVIPLIVAALSLGIAGLGDLRRLGRVGLKTLVYTVCVSSIAVALGIGLVHLFKPGVGVAPEVRAELTAQAADRANVLIRTAEAPKTGIDLLVGIIPSNPIAAMADGDFLAVMFFALMLGIGMALTRTDAARKLEAALEGLFDVTMRLIDLVIAFAPIGVGALIFSLTAEFGWSLLWRLAGYVLVVLLALLIHQFVTYSLAVRLFGGMSPLAFFKGAQTAMVTAFSTASSNATLPTALRVAEEELHLPRDISRFVLTVGATANQNGTALFEGVTVLFLAQVYGIGLSLPQQILVVLVCILGGIGTAGVPAGSIPVVAMILGMVGIPVEGIGLILGVDRFLDMCRTSLNVTGDLAAAVVISHGEPAGSAAGLAAEAGEAPS